MCGFVGIIDKSKNDNYESIINLLTDSITHRGPDEKKTWIDIERGIYLGFCRLSMLDIKGSSQPMMSNDNRYIMMFNGEIYNILSLKRDLENKGIRFHTNGEIEVLLALFKLDGQSFVKKLDGMFSICIVDIIEQELLLFRDCFGIKPLFYYETEKIIVFASELKAIRHCYPLQISVKSVDLYFRFRFIPAPYTIFENVNKLKAGEYIRFKDGYRKNNQYYSYTQTYERNVFSPTVFNDVLKKDIVSTYEFSDVPLGIFLSGGIDSGIIATHIRESLIQDTPAFCIDYADTHPGSESSIAQDVASELGFNCKTIFLRDNIVDYINKIVYSLDEPFYSTVSASTYYLSEHACQKVKGVLTGDGSDELVFGYHYLRTALNSNDIYEEYLKGIGWLKFVKPEEILNDIIHSSSEIKDILFGDCCMENDSVETLRRVELFKRLPDYHLTRVDRLSMAVGLEVRVPYLRKSYSEYMLSISSDSFLKHQDPKYLLKRGTGSALPTSLQSVLKKPFTAPTRHWIEHELQWDIIRLLSDINLMDRLHLKSDKIHSLLTSYSGKYEDISNIWGLYLLLKWAEIDLSIEPVIK